VVSYPANLRLTVQSMTEAPWLVYARAERRPPMPWFNLREIAIGTWSTSTNTSARSARQANPPRAPVVPGGKVKHARH